MKELHTIEELDLLLEESNKLPVLLFKHSLTCPISARAYREFTNLVESGEGGVSYGLIVVQNSRAVSNAVAERFGIKHETPQAILIRDGHESWNASHFDITATAIGEAIRQVSEKA